MIIRIVKLSIQKKYCDRFLEIFSEYSYQIRHFDGCQHLEVLQDHSDDSIFYTYSIWESDTHLQAYRRSDFFRTLWPQLKSLFGAKPEAFSSTKLMEIQ